MPVADILVYSRNPISAETYIVPGEKLIQGGACQLYWKHYADQSGQFVAGVWEAGPSTWNVTYHDHEFCHLLEGTVTIRDCVGGEVTLGPGDSFVIPAGFRGSWQTHGQVRKLYVGFAPKLVD